MQGEQQTKGQFDKWLSRLSLDEETRSYMQELARLYEIMYDELRTVLKKCLEGDRNTTNQMIEQQNRIRKILKGLASQKDPFVNCLKHVNFVKQYVDELKAMDQILTVTLGLEETKENTRNKLRNKAFSAINLGKEVERGEHSLKKEIKQSAKRCLRAKSGTKLEDILQANLQMTRENTQNQNNQSFSEMLKKFKSMRKELQKLLRQVVSRPNQCQITFGKKYEDLPAYFQKRIEFANYFMGQDYIRKHQQEKKPITLEPTEHTQQHSPFLTQFNIKTKSLKPHVRRKIDEAIREVKVRLIQQFHANRTNKFMQINTEQHIQLVKAQPRPKSSERCQTSASLHRSLNKWTRQTGRSGSTRVSTANITRPSTKQYRQNIPMDQMEIDQRLLDRLKRSTYR